MGFQQENGHKTPLKLYLFTEKSEPLDMLSPPPQTIASVPFHWEEAPGKPRYSVDGTMSLPPKPKVARSLDLPPRLAKVTKPPSPTTVLEGPYTCRKLPRAMSFTFSGGAFKSFRGSEKKHMDGQKIVGKCDGGFSSFRWEGSQERSGEWRSVSDISYSVGSGSRSESDYFSKVKIAKFRKRSSFFGSAKSHTLMNIYESVKQAVHWRRKQ